MVCTHRHFLHSLLALSEALFPSIFPVGREQGPFGCTLWPVSSEGRCGLQNNVPKGMHPLMPVYMLSYVPKEL